MWTGKNRSRYASDLTDTEPGLIAPLIPPAKRGRNKRRVEMRSVIDSLMCVLKERRLRFSPIISTCRPPLIFRHRLS